MHAVPGDTECLGDRVSAGCGPELRPAGQGLLATVLHVCIPGLL